MSLEKHFELVLPAALKKLDPNFDGYIFVSDIDRTYLDTQIDSLGGLLRAAFETPERKTNIPGFSIVLRAVRRGPFEVAQANPLYFLSASPPQISAKIFAKMKLDGVEHDGVIFKNQLKHIQSGNFNKLREQLSYKLAGLLQLWSRSPKNAKLIFFGDDSESDAVVFSLFAEIVAGGVRGRELYQLLRYLGVGRPEAIQVAWASRNLGEASFPVHAAFINLETGSQPHYYDRLGPFLFATESSLQTALTLAEFGLIRARAVVSVARDLVLQHDVSPQEMADAIESGASRGLYSTDTIEAFWPLLQSNGFLPARPFVKSLEALQGSIKEVKSWRFWYKKHSLTELKKKYSDEGRY
ncbi:MAG TPA: phosphatase domain-containing protein [Bdellovibrionota bacterium]|jgi:hypothetical protein|nr:phosphatase domain-containing protein [Bdellovibrionota bacterium]